MHIVTLDTHRADALSASVLDFDDHLEHDIPAYSMLETSS